MSFDSLLGVIKFILLRLIIALCSIITKSIFGFFKLFLSSSKLIILCLFNDLLLVDGVLLFTINIFKVLLGCFIYLTHIKPCIFLFVLILLYQPVLFLLLPLFKSWRFILKNDILAFVLGTKLVILRQSWRSTVRHNSSYRLLLLRTVSPTRVERHRFRVLIEWLILFSLLSLPFVEIHYLQLPVSYDFRFVHIMI